MAYIQCTLKSQMLASSVDVRLYFPTDLPPDVGNAVNGVVTLLHGYTNCGDDWMEMSAAPRYAADNGLVLIAPSCQNSFYHNMAHGGAWYSFVTEEMPALLGRIFHLPTEREKNWIAGLSMGGYGALYLGLSRPDLYAGCASFSGAVDAAMMLAQGDREMLRPVMGPILGDDLVLPETSDLRVLAARVSRLPADRQPKILLTNGAQDIPDYAIKYQNDAMHESFAAMSLAHYRRMEWDGVHEWNFWDRSLVYALDYFLENGYAARKHADWAALPTVF